MKHLTAERERERERSKEFHCTYQRCNCFEVFQMAMCRPVAGGTCYLNEASLEKTCKTAIPFLTQLGSRDTACVWAGIIFVEGHLTMVGVNFNDSLSSPH